MSASINLSRICISPYDLIGRVNFLFFVDIQIFYNILYSGSCIYWTLTCIILILPLHSDPLYLRFYSKVNPLNCISSFFSICFEKVFPGPREITLFHETFLNFHYLFIFSVFKFLFLFPIAGLSLASSKKNLNLLLVTSWWRSLLHFLRIS